MADLQENTNEEVISNPTEADPTPTEAKDAGKSESDSKKTGDNPKKYRHSAKDFDFEATLGDGAFSKVVIGKVISSESPFCGEKYAIKIMDKRHIVKNDKIKYVNIEKQVFIATKEHPFICHMHFGFQDSYSLYLALDLCSDEELSYVIYKYIKLNELITIVYTSEILSCLEYMHNKGIYHRDIKPENVLIHGDGHIRLTDFGTCKIIKPSEADNIEHQKGAPSSKEAKKLLKKKIEKARRQSFIGTALYVPPEMLTVSSNNNNNEENESSLQGIDENKSANAQDSDDDSDGDNDENDDESILDETCYYAGMDFWALGCIIYQCLLGKAPFAADNEYLIFKKIESLTYDLPNDNNILSNNARDIIKKFLNPNLKNRLGIDTNNKQNGINNIKNHAFYCENSIIQSHNWDYNKMKNIEMPKFPQTPKNSPVHLMRQSESNDTAKLLNNRKSTNDSNVELANKSNNNNNAPAMIVTSADTAAGGASSKNEANYVLMNDSEIKNSQNNNDCCCNIL